MRRIKNKIKRSVRNWLDDCDMHNISLVIAGFFTLMLIGGISLIMFVACIQIRKGNDILKKDNAIESTLHTARYTRSEIPQMMTDPEQRAAYCVKHYWDGYSLADIAFIHSNDTEQLFSDFIGALQYVAPKESSTALKRMMSRMKEDSTTYSRFCFLSEKYLYDPDCSNYRKYEQIFSEILAFLEMQEKGILRVLAVYPDDDEKEWLLKSSHIPRGWIVGWNKQGDIRNKTLYEIRATPTMYLLGKQKKVMLKDASLEQTIQYLSVVIPNQLSKVI